MAAADPATFFETWPARMSAAKSAAPDVAAGFAALFKNTMKDGALSAQTKELLALAIGIALRCDSCVLAHIQKSLSLGVTRAQILETAGVAVLMQGGPGYTYLPTIVEALNALQPAATANN